jgi:hypothetical protein
MSLSSEVSPEVLAKVKAGKCCIDGCDNPAELIRWAASAPAILCDAHQDDGTATHSGEYVYKSAYYNNWTCCFDIWKKSLCRHLRDKFEPLCGEIPITARQLARLAEKQEDARIAEEERLRQEAQYAAGHDEYYDR